MMKLDIFVEKSIKITEKTYMYCQNSYSSRKKKELK